MFPGEPRDCQRSRECGECRRQPRSPLRGEMQQESDRSGPVVENRLLKPRVSVQAWSDPVAGSGHGARDPDVARLIGADEADGAQAAEKADTNRRCGQWQCPRCGRPWFVRISLKAETSLASADSI